LVAEWLWQAGLLVQDEQSALRPSAAAYTWLQLPPAPALRLLFEAAGFGAPLPANLITLLLTGGVLAEPLIRPLLDGLVGFGLARQDGRTGLYLAPAQVEVKGLLAQLAVTPAGLPPDDSRELELAYQWELCFPGRAPAKGWLTWQPAEFCYTFAQPEAGQSLTLNPWQLFRLVGLCDLCPAPNQSQLGCQPTAQRVNAALRRGVSHQLVRKCLEEPLEGGLPQQARSIINVWLRDTGRVVAREVVLLETAERGIMTRLVKDKRLRSYLIELVSPRHATLRRNDLGRLRRLLASRGLTLQLDPSLQTPAFHRGGVSLSLSRAQLQTILVGLTLYRHQELAEGFAVTELDNLLALLKGTLTMRENKEALDLAAQILNPPGGPPQTTGTGRVRPDPNPDLRRQLEEAIEREAEVLIEYAAPNRPAQTRWVEPHSLYDQDEHSYLLAFCRLRQAERLFRLDRMRLVQIKD
jgi:hypothetical protein